jgi:hypothetical protein
LTRPNTGDLQDRPKTVLDHRVVGAVGDAHPLDLILGVTQISHKDESFYSGIVQAWEDLGAEDFELFGDGHVVDGWLF